MRLDFILPWYAVLILALLTLAFLILCLSTKKWRRPKNFRRVAILFLMVAILARPTLPGGMDERADSNITAFFVVDLTGSMAAEDVNDGSRLDQAKKDMLEIINTINISRFSIIVQDSATYNLMPASRDKDAAKDIIENLAPKPTDASMGTNLVELLTVANTTLLNYAKRFPDSQNIVFILTDGENALNHKNDAETSELPNSLFVKAAAGVVLGYGSTTGAPLPFIESAQSGFLTSEEDAVDTVEAQRYLSGVVSRIDEEYLKKIAEKYDFSYIHRDNAGQFASSLKLKLDEEVDFDQNGSINSRTDLYWLFAIILAALVLWEFFNVINMVLAEREKNK